MPSNPASPRRRRASAALAIALYLAAGVAAPLAHARSEVLSSRPEVEAQHTPLCARIHTEAACQVGLTFLALSAPPRGLSAGHPERSGPLACGREIPLLRAESSGPPPVRAPPTA